MFGKARILHIGTFSTQSNSWWPKLWGFFSHGECVYVCVQSYF